jgi:hypothetical protein
MKEFLKNYEILKNIQEKGEINYNNEMEERIVSKILKNENTFQKYWDFENKFFETTEEYFKNISFKLRGIIIDSEVSRKMNSENKINSIEIIEEYQTLENDIKIIKKIEENSFDSEEKEMIIKFEELENYQEILIKNYLKRFEIISNKKTQILVKKGKNKIKY